MPPLKRINKLISYSRDHRSSLLVAQMMKKNAPAYPGLPQDLQGKMQYIHMHFVTHMFPHFEKEEAELFPAVKGKSEEIDNMIDELINEHAQLMHNINSLPHVADPVTLMDTTGRLLERHIRKEERELFQMIQDNFTEEELAKNLPH
jgi:hemerythrin-like domain-containing protein